MLELMRELSIAIYEHAKSNCVEDDERIILETISVEGN
jgi:hypothetical protein